MGQIGYLFNIIFTYPIFNALMLLDYLFHDFGLSIIVLTLIIKLILFPLTIKQLKSMKATQALQPKMAEINKKYAKDQQAKLAATQALHKEYGINPVAGCLPMLVQFPVLYGLFFALSNVLRATNLQVGTINSLLYPFVPHFAQLPDLNLKWFTFINSALQFPLNHPDPTHVLPIVAGLATFVQLRMSISRNAAANPSVAASDPTAQSMKMMQYIMPVFTAFIGWTFPAGLALYWTVSSIFQAVQQYFVTGWGGLLVTPNFNLKPAMSGASNGSNGTIITQSSPRVQRRERAPLARSFESDNGVVEGSVENAGSQGSTEGQLGTVPRPASNGNGSASARRRPGSGSASARRRSSNNTQKRKPSTS